MKKIISLLLVLAMMTVCFAGCGNDKENASGGEGEKASLTDSLEDIAHEITEKCPVEFAADQIPIDLTDTTEDGKWMIQSNLGLEDVSQVKEAVVYEPMMGSMAFSMVLVRVNDPADTKEVAQAMKDGIDPRKWVCVEADDIQTVGYGDVIFFIMLDSGLDLESQSFVDAFREICGAEPDFVM